MVGGTSLGANVALEFGVKHPDRAQGLFVEMPVLDNALVAVAIAFTPILVGTQLGAPLLGVVAGLARRIPRSHYLVDIGLDWVAPRPAQLDPGAPGPAPRPHLPAPGGARARSRRRR